MDIFDLDMYTIIGEVAVRIVVVEWVAGMIDAWTGIEVTRDNIEIEVDHILDLRLPVDLDRIPLPAVDPAVDLRILLDLILDLDLDPQLPLTNENL